MYKTDAPNLRKIVVKVLPQTTSTFGCKRIWSTFSLIHPKRHNKLGHRSLQKLVFIHYNMHLRMRNIADNHSREIYIDLYNIFCEKDKENPLYEGVKEIKDPMLDKPDG